MSTLIRLLPLVALFTLGLVAARAAAGGGALAEVARVEEERIAALLKGNVKALEQIFADDMVYVHAAGRIDTKQGYLAILAGGNLNYVTLRYDPAPRMVAAGPDTVIVTGRAMIETKNKAGQVTARTLTTTTVYARAGAAWKVVSYQGTPVQP